MIKKIQLLLSSAEPQNSDKLADLLVKEWEAVKQALPGIQHRRAIRVPGDPTSNVPQDGQPDEVSEQPSFDVVFELRGEEVPLETLSKAVEGIGERLASVIDQTNSAALVGTEHMIVPGAQPLFLNMALRRLPKWSKEEWHDHWLGHHAAEVRENVSGLQGYRQFHADELSSRKAAEMAGVAINDFEGTAEGYYSDIDKFLETLSDPEVSKDSGFIDHGRSVMWLYSLTEMD